MRPLKVSDVARRIARPLHHLARLMPRRYLWLALTLLMLPAGLLAVEINPTPRTFAVAGLYTLCLIGSLWMMRAPERDPQPDPADPHAEIRAQLSLTRAELKKTDAWMRLFPLGILLAALLKFTTLTNLELSSFIPLLLELGRSGSRTVLAFLILLLVLLYAMRRSLLLNREVRRLEQLHAALRSASAAPILPPR